MNKSIGKFFVVMILVLMSLNICSSTDFHLIKNEPVDTYTISFELPIVGNAASGDNCISSLSCHNLFVNPRNEKDEIILNEGIRLSYFYSPNLYSQIFFSLDKPPII